MTFRYVVHAPYGTDQALLKTIANEIDARKDQIEIEIWDSISGNLVQVMAISNLVATENAVSFDTHDIT